MLLMGLLIPMSLVAQNSTLRYKTNNRNATESIDAAVYNPAGMVWLKDGFHIEVGNQLGFGGKKVYDGYSGTTYDGNGGSAFDPTAIFVYKKNKLAANFAFGASGASGGSMPDGSPMITMAGFGLASQLAGGVNQALLGIDLPAEIVDPFTNSLYAPNYGSLEEGALDLGFMANIAYKATDWLSLSVGARYLYRSDDYMRGSVALATNQQAINDFSDVLGTMMPPEMVDAVIGQVPVINDDAARVDVSYENNNYWKFSIAANIRPSEKLLIAQTLYFGPSYTANININELYVSEPLPKDEIFAGFEEMLGMDLTDGAPDERSINPFYTLGVAYHVNDKLRLETNFNATFKSGDAVNEYSYGLGGEYQISNAVNWGAGFKYAPVRQDINTMGDTDFKNDFMWIASGVDIKITERLTGVVTAELGVPTTGHEYYMEDGTLEKRYSDTLNKSATFGVIYSF